VDFGDGASQLGVPCAGGTVSVQHTYVDDGHVSDEDAAKIAEALSAAPQAIRELLSA